MQTILHRSYRRFLTIIPLFFSLFFLWDVQTYAFVGATKNVIELSIPAIKNLAALGRSKGKKYVDTILDREYAILANKLTKSQMKYFYEVNYLKILVEQRRITPIQMDEYYRNLKDVRGFKKNLSMMIGKDSLGTNTNLTGHGFELEVANTLVRSKFKVLSLGDRFDDGIKLAKTDVDILAEKGGKKFAFELKNYRRTYFKLENRAKFYDDIKSLKAYMNQHNDTQGVFLMRNPPDKDTMQHLIAIGKADEILVGFGDPSTFIKMFLEASK